MKYFGNGFRTIAAMSIVLGWGSTYASAQVSEAELGRMGLEVAWRAHINQSPSAGVPISVQLFAHPTKRKQSVTLVSNGRVMERISGDAIDRDAYEQMVLKSDIQSANAKALPRLGLEGARTLVAKTEARLQVLGQKFERVEIDQPIIYLVTTSSDGNVQVFDAETGESLWNTVVGQSHWPTRPAGVSDKFVSVINGRELFVLRLEDGTIFTSRILDDASAGSSIPVGNWVYVPGLGGHMFAYDVTSKGSLPWRNVTGGNTTALPVLSADHRFLAWNCEPRFVNIAKVDDRSPSIWNRVECAEPVRSSALPIRSGLIIATEGGGVMKVSLPAEGANAYRNNGLVWRVSSGIIAPNTPIATDGVVYIWSKSSGLTALAEEDGTHLWNEPIRGVLDVLSITSKHLYVRTVDDRLAVLDSKTGEVVSASRNVIPASYTNTLNDRLIFISSVGQLVCVREIGASSPIPQMGDVPVSKRGDGKADAAKPPAKDANAATSDDPFGAAPTTSEPVKPAASGDPFGSAGDPFGAAPPSGGTDTNKKAADPNDPFGSF